MSTRAWALALALCLIGGLAVLMFWRVPLTAAPAPRADQVAALRELPAGTAAKGRALTAAMRPGMYGGMLMAVFVALALGCTPLGSRLVAAVGRPFGGHWLAEGLLGGLVVIFAGEVVTLPFAAWRQQVSRRYGLSTQSWAAWLGDVGKSFAVTAVIAAVALVGFFLTTRLFHRWWWAVAGGCAAAAVLALTFIFPVLVEPLFNHFTPMPPGPQRDALLALADRDGVPARDVLIADASRRTTALNAYVSGIGSTRRIVVYDTLLREAPSAEVRSVVAHELGHAKDNDVLTGSLLAAGGVAVAACGVYLVGEHGALLRRAGVDSIVSPRAVPLLLALATVAALVTGPAQAFVSRRIEARADLHALRLTDDPTTFEAMMTRLAITNIADVDPSPVEYALFASHPSPVRRLAMARAWQRSHALAAGTPGASAGTPGASAARLPSTARGEES